MTPAQRKALTDAYQQMLLACNFIDKPEKMNAGQLDAYLKAMRRLGVLEDQCRVEAGL